MSSPNSAIYIDDDNDTPDELAPDTVQVGVLPNGSNSTRASARDVGLPRKARQNPTQITEFHRVEDTIRMSNRRLSRSYDNMDIDPPPRTLPDSASSEVVEDDSFTRDARRQRELNSSSSDADAPRQSLESPYMPTMTKKAALAKENPSNLRHTFIQSDGQRRDSGDFDSPDELSPVKAESGSTVTRTRPRSIEKPHDKAGRHQAHSPLSGLDRSNVPRGPFSSPTKRPVQPEARKSKAAAKKNPSGDYEVQNLRFGPIIISDTDNYILVVKSETKPRMLQVHCKDGRLSDESIRNFPLDKIVRIAYGRDECCKMCIHMSKSGTDENKMLIMLRSNKQVVELACLLTDLVAGCKTIDYASDKMDAMFEKQGHSSSRLSANGIQDVRQPARLARDPWLNELESKTKYEAVRESETPRRLRTVDQMRNVVGTQKGADARIPTVISRKDRETSEIQDLLSSQAHSRAQRRDDHSRSTEIKSHFFGNQPTRLLGTRSTSRQLSTYVDDDDDFNMEPQKIDLGPPWSEPLVYPKIGKKRAEVEFHDLDRLEESEFLNDNLIGFFMRYLEHQLEQTSPVSAKDVYFFNTYFFATLTKTPKGKRGINYDGVQKWTRNVDIFTRKYIVVPINENAHWYVAIICNLNNLERNPPALDDADDVAEVEARPELPSSSPVPSPKKDALSSKVSATDIAASTIAPASPKKIVIDVEGNEESQTAASLADLSISDQASADGKGSLKSGPPAAVDLDQLERDVEEKNGTPTHLCNPSLAQSKEEKVGKTETPPKLLNSAPEGKVTSSKKSRRQSGPKHEPNAPVIFTMDPLGMSRSPTIKILREYIVEEGKAKRGMEIDGKDIKGMTAGGIPTQTNWSDCGLYLLAFVEKFMVDPTHFVEKVLQREMDSTLDWPLMISNDLRDRLRQFILALHTQQHGPSKPENLKAELTELQPVGKILLGPPRTPTPEPEVKELTSGKLKRPGRPKVRADSPKPSEPDSVVMVAAQPVPDSARAPSPAQALIDSDSPPPEMLEERKKALYAQFMEEEGHDDMEDMGFYHQLSDAANGPETVEGSPPQPPPQTFDSEEPEKDAESVSTDYIGADHSYVHSPKSKWAANNGAST